MLVACSACYVLCLAHIKVDEDEEEEEDNEKLAVDCGAYDGDVDTCELVFLVDGLFVNGLGRLRCGWGVRCDGKYGKIASLLLLNASVCVNGVIISALVTLVKMVLLSLSASPYLFD